MPWIFANLSVRRRATKRNPYLFILFSIIGVFWPTCQKRKMTSDLSMWHQRRVQTSATNLKHGLLGKSKMPEVLTDCRLGLACLPSLILYQVVLDGIAYSEKESSRTSLAWLGGI